jgi:hypothetical protein
LLLFILIYCAFRIHLQASCSIEGYVYDHVNSLKTGCLGGNQSSDKLLHFVYFS